MQIPRLGSGDAAHGSRRCPDRVRGGAGTASDWAGAQGSTVRAPEPLKLSAAELYPLGDLAAAGAARHACASDRHPPGYLVPPVSPTSPPIPDLVIPFASTLTPPPSDLSEILCIDVTLFRAPSGSQVARTHEQGRWRHRPVSAFPFPGFLAPHARDQLRPGTTTTTTSSLIPLGFRICFSNVDRTDRRISFSRVALCSVPGPSAAEFATSTSPFPRIYRVPGSSPCGGALPGASGSTRLLGTHRASGASPRDL